MLPVMCSRGSQFVATASLLLCLICPILETFDHWDHTAKTGSDTEYTFVVLGLCIGATYAFAHVISKLIALRRSARNGSPFHIPARVVFSLLGLSFVFSIPISPPPTLALRI